jgi:hypothetical protein
MVREKLIGFSYGIKKSVYFWVTTPKKSTQCKEQKYPLAQT